MNTEKVQAEINRIVEENHKRIGRAARKQYRVAKHQEETLRELGILELMPNAPYSQYVGHADAKAVIEAAQDSGKAVGGFNAYGEGDVAKMEASALYTLLNEAKETIQIGDFVIVAPHETHGDLRQGAVQPTMHSIYHEGYNRVRVTSLIAHSVGMPVEVEVEVYNGMFDYVSIDHCRKLS